MYEMRRNPERVKGQMTCLKLAADALSRQDDRRQRIFELTLLIQLRFIQLDVQLLMMTKMAEDNNGCHDGVGLNHEVSKTRSLHKVYFYREGH